MRRLPSLLLLVFLLGVGGCSTTVFETIPTGNSTDCDPAWPGRWQPVATDEDASGDATKPKDAMEISADCKTATTKGEAKPMHLTLISTRTGQYLQVHNDSGEPDCIGEGKAHCGYVLLRYQRDGDIVRLFDPNHAKVAAAIAKGRLKGFSDRADGKQLKTSEPIYRNFLAGDANGIDTLLRRHPELFNAEPMMVLQHTADVSAAVEAVAPADPVAPDPEH